MRTTLAIVIFSMLLTACATPRLAVLPLISGDLIADDISNDIDETFAWQLANAATKYSFYDIIPITPKIQRDIKVEQTYHSAFNAGRELRADFVMASFAGSLGDKWIFYVVIMDVKTKELIAGDYREFKYLSDISNFFTSMTRKIMTVSQHNIKERRKRYKYIPSLAVDILQIPTSEYFKQGDAVILTQIIANEMANNGKFRVFPRADVMDAAAVVYGNNSYLPETADVIYGNERDAVSPSHNYDPMPVDYVLSSKLSSLETPPAAPFDLLGEILYVKKNRLVTGGHVTFDRIENAPVRIAQLAARLSSLTTVSPR